MPMLKSQISNLISQISIPASHIHHRPPAIPYRTSHIAHRTSRSRGVALLLVLFVLAVCVTITVTFVAAQSTTIEIASNIDRHGRARSIAESAIELVMARVRSETQWRHDYTHAAWSTPRTLDGGTFTYRFTDGVDTDGDGTVDDTDGSLIDDGGDTFTLTVRGEFDGVSSVLSVTVEPRVKGSRVLMMMLDTSKPEAVDKLLISMFESWGCIIETIDHNANRANCEARAVGKDVVYIASSCHSSKVGTKFNNVEAGVVTHEAAVNDDMGFNTASVVRIESDTVEIVDNTLYITETLPLGNMLMLHQVQGLRYLNGPLTPSALMLAQFQSPNRPFAAAFEKGVPTAGGGGSGTGGAITPGRRVYLPWTRDADPSWLTDHGRDLVLRSLEWGAGLDAPREYHGIEVTGSIELKDDARVDAIDTREDNYNPSNNSTQSAAIATNSTANNAIELKDNAVLVGDAENGVGGNPQKCVSFNSPTQLKGTRAMLRAPIVVEPVTDPPGIPGGYPGPNYNYELTGNANLGTYTYEFRNFTMKNSGRLRVYGTVVLYCNEKFKMEDNSRIDLMPGAAITIFADTFEFKDNARANMNPYRAGLLELRQHGGGDFSIEGDAKVAAKSYGPNADLKMKDDARYLGIFEGRSATIEKDARFTHDFGVDGRELEPPPDDSTFGEYVYFVRWTQQP